MPLPDVQLGLCGTFSTFLRDVGGVHKLHYNDTVADFQFADTGMLGAGTIPIGGIILWYGNIASIPANWALCDGSVHGGLTTPDLRNRFVICADADAGGVAKTTVEGGATQSGGDINYTPAGTQGNPTINDHAVHNHPIDHTHGGGPLKQGTLPGAPPANAYVGNSGNNAAVQTHVVAAPGAFAGTADTIIPPYYALAYIMRYA
jgi:hypothetical protein